MPVEYLQIAESEGEEPIELPTEDDGTLLLSTVLVQFPGSCGLKYRNPESNTMRVVRLSDGRLHAPSETGWGSQIFYCAFPKENKRKLDDPDTEPKRVKTNSFCTDLIVLGLPWETTEQNLREYFEQFGELLMTQIKKDAKTGKSKGYGFIRFSSYTSQMRVLAKRHMIGEKWCDVKVPNSKEGVVQRVPSKVFVGRCTEDLTPDDLKEYFGKFGEVTDVFRPKPFRSFCFVTFLDPEVAQSLCGENHLIKGASVYVSNADPKSQKREGNDRNGGRHDANRERNGSNGGGINSQRYGPGSNQGNRGYQGQRGNLDMSNLQGIMDQGALSMTPALLAAALNQAGWGPISNSQNQTESNFNLGFNKPQSYNAGNNVHGGNQGGGNFEAFFNWLNQGQQGQGSRPLPQQQEDKGNNANSSNEDGGNFQAFLNWINQGQGQQGQGSRPLPQKQEEKGFLKYE